MTRHARMTLDDDTLDALHVLKRRLSREQQRRVTLDDLLHEAVRLLLRYHAPIPGNNDATLAPEAT